MQRTQKGFTLVEIAVVLVIIGLLLGGVLKGQELIASARVRNLADQQSGIQAAYYGFIDRYRAVPGDMDGADAANAIGVTDTPADYPGGNANGRLEDPATDGNWPELNAVWVHLADANFMSGSFEGADAAPTAGNNDVSPLNVFSSPVVMARHDAYSGDGAARLLLHLGQNVPVEIAQELDTKLDDGRPNTGTLRNADTGSLTVYQSADGCIDDSTTPPQWDVEAGVTNCNPTYLF